MVTYTLTALQTFARSSRPDFLSHHILHNMKRVRWKNFTTMAEGDTASGLRTHEC